MVKMEVNGLHEYVYILKYLLIFVFGFFVDVSACRHGQFLYRHLGGFLAKIWQTDTEKTTAPSQQLKLS